MQNLFFSILLAASVLGCAGEADKTESVVPTTKLKSEGQPEIKQEGQPEIKQEAPKMITLRGTVRYKKIEGGFWGLDGHDGNKYMPAGLSKALLIDGMVIEVTGIVQEDKDLMTFQQYGKILKVEKAKMIDNNNARALNSY